MTELGKKIKGMSRKQRILYVFAICVWAYAGYLIPTKIVFVKTPSLDYRFFFRQAAGSNVEVGKGAYVRFDIYTKMVPNCRPCEVTKKIACDEGESLLVRDRKYYCEKMLMGRAKTHSLKGVPVESFTYDGVVPRHRFFAWGGHRDSYDSRYYGFVEKSRVKEVLIPIF